MIHFKSFIFHTDLVKKNTTEIQTNYFDLKSCFKTNIRGKDELFA